MSDRGVSDIAVIGMAGRFPGARTVEAFWQNILTGVESISFFSPSELEAAGWDPARIASPDFVAARGVLEGADEFDAGFFGISPRDAELMDPQHRLFVECAHAALEDAGCDPHRYAGWIGVIAGCGDNSYLHKHVAPSLREHEGDQAFIGNEKDFLALRVSYLLNLRGPSYDVQTACSTSLVAVHLACQALSTFQADIMIAGGSHLIFPQVGGSTYQEGSIVSRDGHCRAFDEKASGIVGGSGVAAVVLKRLDDAIADRDHIHAVILGSAINNDGHAKMSFTAPSVPGQAEVVTLARELAGISAEQIGYIETHGTGTRLGDPIEIAALRQSFAESTERRQFCAIGSAKTNIGHLGAAAGVAGLIKAVMAVREGVLPPSLHFDRANPEIDFETSPFYVNTVVRPWPEDAATRCAAVTSLGLGGTNAHVILEEAPRNPESGAAGQQLLVLSARSPRALARSAGNLRSHLEQHAHLNLGDVAWTLKVGRKAHSHRGFVVASSTREAVTSLGAFESRDAAAADAPAVVFMFPGGGSHYVGMGRQLYDRSPRFREALDECRHLLEDLLGQEIGDKLFLTGERSVRVDAQEVDLTFAALVSLEYALAQQWLSLGIEPTTMVGHSLGEYVAACLCGALSLRDTLRIVLERTKLLARVPGGMLRVQLPEHDALRLAGTELDIAAVNGPQECVLSGATRHIDAAIARLRDSAPDVQHRVLPIDAAAHSRELEAALPAFREFLETIEMRPPASRAWISCVTGKAIEEVSPDYWCRHLRSTVRFHQAIDTVLQQKPCVLLEVGPGVTLTTLTTSRHEPVAVVASLPHPSEAAAEETAWLTAVGRLWQAGVPVNLDQVDASGARNRVPLPTYPFERQKHWISQSSASQVRPYSQRSPLSEWFYTPTWERTARPTLADELSRDSQTWLVLAGRDSLSQTLLQVLRASGQDVRAVYCEGDAGDAESQRLAYPLDPDGYAPLVQGRRPRHIVHLWSRSAAIGGSQAPGRLAYYSTLYLLRTLGDDLESDVSYTVVTDRLESVTGSDACDPEKALVLGPCLVAPQEYPRLSCRTIDLEPVPDDLEEAARRVIAECLSASTERRVAYRNRRRYALKYVQTALEADRVRPLERGGAYVITGGLGRVGMLLARHLTSELDATVVLLSRSLPPERANWPGLLADESTSPDLRHTLRVLTELEAANASYRILQVDITDGAAMQRLSAQLQRDYGSLAGVIHAAAVTRGPSLLCPMKSLDQHLSETQLAPKVEGLLALDEAMAPLRPKVALLLSSNASVLGGLGFCAYAAANSHLDAFAASGHGRLPWMSSNWDGWLLDAAQSREPWASSMDAFTMSPEESLAAVRRIMSGSNVEQVVVSAGSLQPRLDLWVGKAAVPAMPDPLDTATATEAAADSSVAESLALMWRGLLGVTQIQNSDNFFALGGHSLMAVQLNSRMQSRWGVQCTLQDLFHARTFEGLCTLISARVSSARRDLVPTIPRTGGAITLPMSNAQQRLWYTHLLKPDSAGYHLHLHYRVEGPLRPDMLDAALADVVARHESLRTSFSHGPDGGLQEIHPHATVALTRTDLSGAGDDERDREISRLRRVNRDTPFDLSAAPLLRAHVIGLAKDDHLLLLTLHHIIADGWGLHVFLRDLTACYRARLSGQPADLPALQVDVADYTVWQQTQQQQPDFAEQLQRCVQRHRDLPTIASLSFATGPEGMPGNGREPFLIPETTRARLADIALAENTTLFVTLSAVYATVLSDFGHTTRVAIGTVDHGRHRLEFEDVVGLFVNPVVLDVRVRDDVTFLELLRHVREVATAALHDARVPFDLLVRELGGKRDVAANPLFRTSLTLQNTPAAVLPLPDLTLTTLEDDQFSSRIDLELELRASERGLDGGIFYDTALFSREMIAELGRSFVRVVEAVAAAPHTRVRELPVVDRHPAAPASISGDADVTAFLPSVVAAHAALRPDAVALRDSSGAVTYAALERRSNQLANYLVQQGVRGEHVVGVCLPGSVDLPVAILAIMKAGAAYLPLSPDYPPAHLDFILADAAPVLVLTLAEYESRFASHAAVAIDEAAPRIAACSERRPQVPLHAHGLAYVIYTSGSTGRPKGVMIEHGSLGNLIQAQRLLLDLGADDCVLQFASASFDASIWEIALAFGAGACLYLDNRDRLTAGRVLTDCLQREHVTCVTLAPTVLDTLDARALPALQWVVSAGEACPPALAELWVKGRHFINAYGPTEATVCVSADHYRQAQNNIIGVPLHGVHAGVLNGAMQPMPTGVAGELWVGGHGVARGYLRRASMTADRFRPDAAAAGGRLYRTGDLVLARADARLRFLGRIDRQVKVNGIRIEPGEIEYALARHAAVRKAVVLTLDDPARGKQLAAFIESTATDLTRADLTAFAADQLPAHMRPTRFVILPSLPYLPGGKVDERALEGLSSVEFGELEAQLRAHPAVRAAAVVAREHHGYNSLDAYVVPVEPVDPSDLTHWLRGRLPEYMVPASLNVLDALPLTPDGQVDRQALPEPEFTGRTRYLAPRTLTEVHLARLWEDVFGVRPISIAASFFDLGGHSLLAIRLLARVEQHFGQRLPLAVLFQTPTIAQLATHLQSPVPTKHPAHIVPIQPEGLQRPLYCLPGVGGQVLYFQALAAHLGSGQPVYGLQTPGLDDGEVFPDSVEQHARELVTALRAHQPKGPYRLLGHSSGARVAFEMAWQLEQQGQHVERVLVLDATPVSLQDERDRHDAQTDLDRTMAGLEALEAAFGPLDLPRSMLEPLPDEASRWYHIEERLRQRQVISSTVDLAQLRRGFRAWECAAGNHTRYRPSGVLQAPLLLVRAQESASTVTAGGPDEAQRDWHPYTRTTVQTENVPGGHITMLLEPHVRALAALVARTLADAAAQSGAPA